MITKPTCGIRGYILLIAVVPVTVITLVLVAISLRTTVIHSERAFNRQGQLLAAQLAAHLEYALSTGDLAQIPDAVATTLGPGTAVLGTSVGQVTVWDRDGQVVFARKPTALPPVVPPPWRWLIDAGAVALFPAVISLAPLDEISGSSDNDSSSDSPESRRYLGRVQLSIPTAPLQLERLYSFLGTLGLIVASLLLALGLAVRLGGRLAGALEEAAAAIAQIKRGDFTVQLKPAASTEVQTLQEGVMLAARAIREGQARLEQALAAVRAEHEQALADLRVQTVAAERANEAKSLFLAKVSHEMRTPLYSIQGLTEQLLKAPHSPAETQHLRHVLAATRLLHQTIGDVLDFTQLEGGSYHPLRERFDPWQELAALSETVQVLCAERGLSLDLIVEPDAAGTVWGDGRAFRTIAANLIANAVKFTEQGGVVIRLQREAGLIACDENDQDPLTLVLSVADTGRGIPLERQARIFEPFEQIDSGLNRQYGGSGLGLTIVRSYCEALGGQIGIDSAPGRGSVFTVRLPVQADPAWTPTPPVTAADLSPAPTPDATTSAVPSAAPASTPPPRPRILVVEDFEINRAIMVQQLQVNGFQIVEAASGEEAVQLALQRPDIDAILMDIQMPGKDGIMAIQEIRAAQGARVLPILGFTASADKPTLQRVLEAGADRVLTKPLSEVELVAAMRLLLSRVSSCS